MNEKSGKECILEYTGISIGITELGNELHGS